MTMTEDDDDVDIMTTTMKTPMAWPYGRPYGVGGYCLPQGVKEWQRQANRNTEYSPISQIGCSDIGTRLAKSCCRNYICAKSLLPPSCPTTILQQKGKDDHNDKAN